MRLQNKNKLTETYARIYYQHLYILSATEKYSHNTCTLWQPFLLFRRFEIII